MSCQAAVDSPLARPEIIAAMALVAQQHGAVGVRINGPANVAAVKQIVDLPIIGIEKRIFPGSEVYITPTFDCASAVAQKGAHLVALDATERSRPGGETLSEIIQRLHNEFNTPVMADVSTFSEGVKAVEELGVELVSTTLAGYTRENSHQGKADFDLVERFAKRLSVPVICEGRLRSPADVTRAFSCGAFSVVVGAAITGIDYLVQKYVAATPLATLPANLE